MTEEEPKGFEFEKLDPKQGDDPVIEEVVSGRFAKMNDQEGLQVALALQQLLRGQTALLENYDKFAKDIAKLKEQMAKYDEDAEKDRKNHERYVQEVFDKAEKLKAVGDAKDKIIAKGAATYKTAIAEANAKNAVGRLQFEDELRRMEMVQVMSPGVLEMVVGNQGQS